MGVSTPFRKLTKQAPRLSFFFFAGTYPLASEPQRSVGRPTSPTPSCPPTRPTCCARPAVPTCCANLLCQPVVPTCCANLLCQPVVPTCRANLLCQPGCDLLCQPVVPTCACQPVVPTCRANLLCQPVVPTCCANLLCQPVVPTCCANLSCAGTHAVHSLFYHHTLPQNTDLPLDEMPAGISCQSKMHPVPVLLFAEPIRWPQSRRGCGRPTSPTPSCPPTRPTRTGWW